jgi:hypothetical protein
MEVPKQQSSAEKKKETAAAQTEEVKSQKKSREWNLSKLVEKLQFNIKDLKPISFFTIAMLIAAIGISWIMTFVLRSSTLIKDYSYLLFSSSVDVPDAILIQLVSELKITVWDILLAAHAGTYQGNLVISDFEGGAFQFQLKLPVIIAPILLFIVFICISWFIKKRLSLTTKEGIKVSVISAACYALIITITMNMIEPAYQTNNITYMLTTSPFLFMIKAFIIAFFAGFIGFQLWRIEKIKQHDFMKPLFKLKRFAVTLLLSVFAFGILLIVMWTLVHPSSIFFTPLTTPTSIWMMYRDDPLIYLLLPAFLLGGLTYAGGGTFAVSDYLTGELLQVSEPFRLHPLLGASAVNQADNEQFLAAVENAAQFSWYTMAFLLIFLFSLNRIKLADTKSMLIGIGYIGIVFMMIARSVTLTLTTENTSGYIGFSTLGSGFAVVFLCLVFYGVKYFLLKKMSGSKVGDHHE